MGDVITRLKVDSKEYDSKIERARRGLLNLEQSLQSAGKTFADADKEQVDFVRELGKMQTVAQTARGKISELTKAYTDMSLQYKQMTDEEKKSPFGQAMSQSLEQLRGRIGEAKTQLGEVNNELGNTGRTASGTGSILEDLAGKFGLNIRQLTGMGAALAAVTGALKIAKDAFFANEEGIDAWGRMMESSKAVYEGFLTALNTGDISGYLSRIDTIVKAATDAYNSLDRLSTMQTIDSPRLSAKQSEVQRMQMMLRTGRYIAPLDGRTGAKENGAILTASDKKAIAQNLKSGMSEVAGMLGNQVKATMKAVDDLYKEQAAVLGMSNKEFREGVSSMAEFEKRLAGAAKYSEWQQKNSYVDQSTGRLVSPTVGNPYSAYKGWSVFKDDGNLYQRIINTIQQGASTQQRYYSQVGMAYRGLNRVESVRGGGGGGGGGAVSLVAGGLKGVADMGVQSIQTTESLKELQLQLGNFKTALLNATNQGDYAMAKAGIASTQRKIGAQPYALAMGVSTESVLSMQDEMTAAMEELRSKLPKLEIEMTVNPNISKEGKKTEVSWQAAAQAVASVGSALQGINDPSAKIAGLVGTAIANIALGFASATAKDSKLGVWGWIAAIAGGLGTMISTIAAIKSATAGSYAEGGIVPGNSYQGDRLTANVNSGELILNRAQQNSIAAQLSGAAGGYGGGNSRAYVSGEMIYLGMNNYLRRSGRGEIVTSR